MPATLFNTIHPPGPGVGDSQSAQTDPYSHQRAPAVTQQPPCYFFVKNYTFKVSFASLKSIYLEKDLQESVKLAKNVYTIVCFFK